MLQPPAEAEALAPDVVLVPLVLADRRGTRIGHGKGHYDRALAHLREGGRPVFTIGLAWETRSSTRRSPPIPGTCSSTRSRRRRNGSDAARAELAAARGIALILLLIAGWAVLVVSAAPLIADAPRWVHVLYYLVAGIVWILPLKPLLRWMETGRWRGRHGSKWRDVTGLELRDLRRDRPAL